MDSIDNIDEFLCDVSYYLNQTASNRLRNYISDLNTKIDKVNKTNLFLKRSCISNFKKIDKVTKYIKENTSFYNDPDGGPTLCDEVSGSEIMKLINTKEDIDMNKETTLWRWKSMIIDFSTLSNEVNDYGGYILKKDMIFSYLGTPDEEIHEWYNGKYSSEYNEAFRYAKQLGLIEEYIDYDEKLSEKDKKIEELTNIINRFEEWLYGEKMTFYRGYNDESYLIAFGDVYSKWKELKGKDE